MAKQPGFLRKDERALIKRAVVLVKLKVWGWGPFPSSKIRSTLFLDSVNRAKS